MISTWFKLLMQNIRGRLSVMAWKRKKLPPSIMRVIRTKKDMKMIWRDRLRGIDRAVDRAKSAGLPVVHLLTERRMMVMKRARFQEE